jgi:hypothetical protein
MEKAIVEACQRCHNMGHGVGLSSDVRHELKGRRKDGERTERDKDAFAALPCALQLDINDRSDKANE